MFQSFKHSVQDKSFSLQKFQHYLQTQWLGRSVLYYENPVDSTMEIAQRILTQMNDQIFPSHQSNLLLLAESQLQGKGRENRTWYSKIPLQNVALSFILCPTSFEELPKLNLCIAMAVCKMMRDDFQISDAHIKWPNDIWIGKKKVCGMLVNSNIYSATDIKAVVGIGINVNELIQQYCPLEEVKQNSISMREAIGASQPLEREKIVALVCNYLETYLQQFFSMEQVLQEYIKYDLLHKQQTIIVMPKKREHSERREAEFVEYSKISGCLVVRYKDTNKVEELLTEEVTIRLE